MQGAFIKDLVSRDGRARSQIKDPYSIIFVVDAKHEVSVPSIDHSGNIWWTASCVAVGCISYMDGKAELTFARRGADISAQPAFDGSVETPSRSLAVLAPDAEILMTADVPSFSTRVQIWTNHPTEPDKIDIFFG
ncbi:hypothetical protein V1281_000627 [Nitrobacteraceae bacterium AZCC 2161]|jgi:hypothetical protein